MNNGQIYDVAIIGGGINGVGIAADAANRGLKVLLCEQNDLASGTSSASSKLIHGGLRYLELQEFRLVREALLEREVLLTTAKHLVKPLNFILPHQSQLRSRYLIRLGLFLYDHLNWCMTLPKSKSIKLADHSASKYLIANYQHAFQYVDCRTDDARLVIANALAAKLRGAEILNYTPCIEAIRENDLWKITLANKFTSQTTMILSRTLINATGPWVPQFLEQNNLVSKHKMALVKGSHIIVPKLFTEEYAFIFQNDDNRVVFVIPYLNHFHLIGTTDVPYNNNLDNVVINEQEKQYLLNAVAKYLKKPPKLEDILYSYAGIRPLIDENTNDHPAHISRDYMIDIDQTTKPTLISIFGGKLTTYRKLAEKVINLLQPCSSSCATTSKMILPGSNYTNDLALLTEFKNTYPWLNESLLRRYLNQFGTLTHTLLSNCRNYDDLGELFGADLYQKEVDYLITHEWAKTVNDILWRRTKVGYFFPQENLAVLAKYMQKILIF